MHVALLLALAAVGIGRIEPTRPEDRDGDGVPDSADLCPDEPEDRDSFEDWDGCPDPDNDKDRIPDTADKCPNEPETYNGIEDGDGCPDRGKVIIHRCKLEIVDKIYFSKGKREIERDGRLLDDIARTLVANPQVVVLEVQGHAAPNEANASALAAARAAAVRAALVARGVPGARLVARSFGSKRLACTAKTEACARQSRRVEFSITKRSDKELASSPAP
jgi:outer membrane protein OmpA-like peptidoglycan-associated protein